MSTANQILDQIDHALHDWSVSDDAMRSQPVVEPRPDTGPRMWIAPAGIGPDEAGWEEIGHITSIDIEPPTVDPEFQRAWQEWLERFAQAEAERVRRAQADMTAFMRTYVEAVKPAAEAAARAVTAFQEALQRDVGTAPAPGRRDGRPAWQSPYGTPRRRR